ncbi:hypothetical protein AB0L10_20250 [Streptomyces flaveolus]|uniref:hypothetical protein n=1 Tax=Streptomyces flaveolus TaxID=67297 RepID=UPI00341BD04B
MTAQQEDTTQGGGAPSTDEAYLLIAKIKPGQADALREALTYGATIMGNPESALSQVGTVHFARFAILDEETLLFASHFDGNAEAYLDDFYTFTQGESFDVVFRYCEGWPGPHDREGFMKFWKSNRVMDFIIYARFPGVTCKQIEKALRIRDNMEAVLEDFQ